MDVVKEVRELKNQLAYSKNIGFFFGAGTSCALKIPNIATLTTEIEKRLKGDHSKHYGIIRDSLKPSVTPSGRSVNIEDILNHTRRIREITNDQAAQDFLTVSGEAAKNLDKEICTQIYRIISESEEKADLSSPRKFFGWLDTLNRAYSKEIFTTNYDLIIEKSLEANQVPYFDGFVGSYEPFFWQESVEQSAGKDDITRNWIRLWKIHGSLNWFWKQSATDRTEKIIRVGKFDNKTAAGQELVIYPSKEKYDSSRKQPFVAYFDRLKSSLLGGELLFFFCGYSFSDQHINDIIFNSLRQNNRLYCVVFCFQDAEVEALHKLTGGSFMNLSVFGPKKAMVAGNLKNWEFIEPDAKDGEKYEYYWDKKTSALKLGDFNELVSFLVAYSGRTDLQAILKK
jgi:hypothetical protein